MKNLIVYTFIFLFLLFIKESKAQIYVIKADRLIDGKSDDLHHDITIIIENNKIIAVGKSIEIPSNAEILDLGDKTILPGFIDAHTHIMVDGVDDYGADIYKNSTSFRAIRAVSSVRKALWRGFTTMRDVCSEGTMYADVDIKRAIDMNIIPGPRLWISTRGLSIPGRYVPFGYSWELDLPKGTQIVSGSDECLSAVREQVANGADWIKIFADWPYHIDKDGGISGQLNFTQEELLVITAVRVLKNSTLFNLFNIMEL
jgi:imidazolonepropionase-like amidohydrolase